MSIKLLNSKERKLLKHPFFESRAYKSQEGMNEVYHDMALNYEAHNMPICCSKENCNKEIGADIYTVCHGFCIQCFLDANANHYDDNWQLKASKTIFKQIAKHNRLVKQRA